MKIHILIVLLMCFLCSADTKYVDGDLGTGDNDGTSWANAWRTLAQAGDVTAVAPGDIVLVSNSVTYSAQDAATSAIITIDDSGTLADGMITYQGCDGTGTDESDFVAAQVILEATTNSLNYCINISGSFISVRNFTVSGATGGFQTGIYGTASDNSEVINCIASDNDGTGIQMDDQCFVAGCVAFDNAIGFDADNYNTMYGCDGHDNTTSNFTMNIGFYINCLSYGTLTNHFVISANGTQSGIFNCTIDGENAGVGMLFDDASQNVLPMIVNNVIYDLATGAASDTTMHATTTRAFNNLCYSNAADTDGDIGLGTWLSDGKLTSAPGFKTEGTDYQPTTVSALIDAGFGLGYRVIGCYFPGDLATLSNVLNTDTLFDEAGTASASSGGGQPVIGGSVVR